MGQNSEKNYYVYILRCCDGSLYTGLTCDLVRRLQEHQQGSVRAARYTRARLPVACVWYSPPLQGRSAAAQLEYRLKRMSRREKLAWIAREAQNGMNPLSVSVMGIGLRDET